MLVNCSKCGFVFEAISFCLKPGCRNFVSSGCNCTLIIHNPDQYCDFHFPEKSQEELDFYFSNFSQSLAEYVIVDGSKEECSGSKACCS